jgi:predicted metal-dependent hydrolase
MQTLTVDDLTFTLRHSPRRRSIEVVVERDGNLLLAAPEGCEASVLTEFVLEKRFWIYQKLARKEALARPQPEKQFVSGEGFYYLGRTYRLLIVDDQETALKLEHGRFRLRREDVPQGREILIRWYTDHAKPWVGRRVQRWSRRIGAEPTGVDVRDLGFRWGSCGKNGRLYFHWRTILLPPHIVDYILVHEIVHLLETRHTRAFWQRIERSMPDYGLRKDWLAASGYSFAV